MRFALKLVKAAQIGPMLMLILHEWGLSPKWTCRLTWRQLRICIAGQRIELAYWEDSES